MQAAVSEATERDRDIVELLRGAGRDRAFEELLRRYEGKVYRLCCALLRDRAQAEDAAQESLLRVWQALDR
jgi:RNA polymerase sigma-70 factor (ECF subfamily)